MRLLYGCLALVKQCGLRKVIGKFFRLGAYLVLNIISLQFGRNCDKTLRCTGLKWATASQRIWFISHAPAWDSLAMQAVALIVMHLSQRRVDGQFMKVGTP